MIWYTSILLSLSPCFIFLLFVLSSVSFRLFVVGQLFCCVQQCPIRVIVHSFFAVLRYFCRQSCMYFHCCVLVFNISFIFMILRPLALNKTIYIHALHVSVNIIIMPLRDLDFSHDLLTAGLRPLFPPSTPLCVKLFSFFAFFNAITINKYIV